MNSQSLPFFSIYNFPLSPFALGVCAKSHMIVAHFFTIARSKYLAFVYSHLSGNHVLSHRNAERGARGVSSKPQSMWRVPPRVVQCTVHTIRCLCLTLQKGIGKVCRSGWRWQVSPILDQSCLTMPPQKYHFSSIDARTGYLLQYSKCLYPEIWKSHHQCDSIKKWDFWR